MMKRCFCTLLGLVVCVVFSNTVRAELFFDNFSTAGSASNYTANLFTADNQIVYAFDYSTVGIPSAPNSGDGSTLGLRMASNVTGGAATGLTLQTVQSFTGEYSIRFDAWINANGPFPGGGAGSTEFITAGVGGDGAQVNFNGNAGSGPAWVAVSGEGGAAQDYRIYKTGAIESFASGQYAAGSLDAADPYYAQFGSIDVGALPGQGGLGAQTGTTIQGSGGFAWRAYELLVNPTGGTGGAASVTWSIDGLRIGTIDAGVGGSFTTDGRAMIGYMDPFNSLSDAPLYSFGLVDNLRVVAIPEPSSLMFLIGVTAAIAMRRRRR